MKMPGIYRMKALLDGDVKVNVGGRWLPARPLPFYSLRSRLRAAWLVLTGRADALIWDYDNRD